MVTHTQPRSARCAISGWSLALLLAHDPGPAVDLEQHRGPGAVGQVGPLPHVEVVAAAGVAVGQVPPSGRHRAAPGQEVRQQHGPAGELSLRAAGGSRRRWPSGSRAPGPRPGHPRAPAATPGRRGRGATGRRPARHRVPAPGRRARPRAPPPRASRASGAACTAPACSGSSDVGSPSATSGGVPPARSGPAGAARRRSRGRGRGDSRARSGWEGWASPRSSLGPPRRDPRPRCRVSRPPVARAALPVGCRHLYRAVAAPGDTGFAQREAREAASALGPEPQRPSISSIVSGVPRSIGGGPAGTGAAGGPPPAPASVAGGATDAAGRAAAHLGRAVSHRSVASNHWMPEPGWPSRGRALRPSWRRPWMFRQVAGVDGHEVPLLEAVPLDHVERSRQRRLSRAARRPTGRPAPTSWRPGPGRGRRTSTARSGRRSRRCGPACRPRSRCRRPARCATGRGVRGPASPGTGPRSWRCRPGRHGCQAAARRA